MFIYQGRKHNVLSLYIQNENHETRLCGNERLKEVFLAVWSVETTFGFGFVEEEEDDDDVDEGFILLIDDDIGSGNGDNNVGETDMGDGCDGIENGVIGDERINVPWWEEYNGSIIDSSWIERLWWWTFDRIEEEREEESSRETVDGDWNNPRSQFVENSLIRLRESKHFWKKKHLISLILN